MNQKHRRSIGNIGEDIAEYFFKKKGFVILARNYRVSRIELDILAVLNGVLYLIEVKSGTHETEIVDHNLNSVKIRRLNRARAVLISNKQALLDIMKSEIDRVEVSGNQDMFHVKEVSDVSAHSRSVGGSVREIREIRLLGIVVQLVLKPGVSREGNYIYEKVTPAIFSKITVCTFDLDDL